METKEEITVEERCRCIDAALPAERSAAMREIGDSLLRADPERLGAACTQIERAVSRARFSVITNSNVAPVAPKSRQRRQRRARSARKPHTLEEFKAIIHDMAVSLDPKSLAKLTAELPYLAARAKMAAVPRICTKGVHS